MYICRISHCLLAGFRAEASQAGWGQEVAATLELLWLMVGGGERCCASAVLEEGDPAVVTAGEVL